jgi:hypothetical protein
LKHQAHGLAAQPSQATLLEVAGILPSQGEAPLAAASLGQQLQNGPGDGAFAAP